LSVATSDRADLGSEQRAAINRARALLDPAALGELVRDMTAIASPTGEEAALAEFLAGHLASAGVEARVQAVHGAQASTIGRIRGSGNGPSILLYSGIDTPFGGGPDEDAAWLGEAPRADWSLPPTERDGRIVGLGADNPKGFAAAAIAAVEAVARSHAGLRGDVWLALASGSMPVAARPRLDRARSGPSLGVGSGINHILDEIPTPDFAVLVKPGYAVAHEEVGFAWFRITVGGALNYTGIRHKGPYRNPVLGAATVIAELEAWSADYAAAHTDGLVAPQVSINAVSAGSADRLAFIPATAEVDLDVRLSPRTTADDAQAELEAAIQGIRERHPELDLGVERILAMPGSATDPSSWIVRSLVAAWEEREGKDHAPLRNGSGASDAAHIRARGIEAARIGPPPPASANPYPGFSMGQADVGSLHALSELLVRVIIDTASRTRAEVGR
jgi:acetylornithine deacetylase/succinyl-diaminopimelate desuccinylase-like protein